MTSETFENVRDQVAACGIWCGSCAVGNGVLADLSVRYEQLLRSYGITEWGPKDVDFDVFFQNLRSLQELEGCPGCLRGGGFEGCPLKPCTAERKLPDCLACDEYGTCERSEALQKIRTGAMAANMVVKTTSGNSEELIERWMNELQGTWPNGLLFVRENDSDLAG